MSNIIEDQRYPIGRFEWITKTTPADRAGWIRLIAGTPDCLRDAVAQLNAQQLDTPYREGGWTVRQVVHHYADDHMNSYMRFKLALAEDAPLIKGYAESVWAELPDARTAPIEPSLQLIDALHQRWVIAWELLRSRIGLAPSSIRPAARSRSTNSPHSTLGMGNTMWRINRLREARGWIQPG